MDLSQRGTLQIPLVVLQLAILFFIVGVTVYNLFTETQTDISSLTLQTADEDVSSGFTE